MDADLGGGRLVGDLDRIGARRLSQNSRVIVSVRAITRTVQPAAAMSLSRFRTLGRVKGGHHVDAGVAAAQSTAMVAWDSESPPSVRGSNTGSAAAGRPFA